MINVITGVILAGGENKRFRGITKAKLYFHGETLISRTVSIIKEFFPEIIIVTNKPEEFTEYSEYIIVGDQIRKSGPLAGIHAALKSTSSDAIFVFACDNPFPDRKIIGSMIRHFNESNADVLVPVLGDSIEPLHAIYRRTLVNDIERFLVDKKKKAVHDFLDEVNTEYFQIAVTDRTRKAFTNINTMLDLIHLSKK
jgi:molybdopterin-guanine dinucleotide biosynthesis protein A